MTAHNTYRERELFVLIASSNELAFREVFDLYQGELFTTALKLTKSFDSAQEITQEVFINLWVSRKKLEEVENPGAYIFRILYNAISLYLRKESNRENIIRSALKFATDISNSTTELIDVHESEQIIEKALVQLPAQQKIIYKLSRQQGLSIDEIAAQLNISPHTVKSHLSKALNFIRTYLKDVAMVTALLASFTGRSSF